MTPELTALSLIAMLAASLWIPYVVGVNTVPAGSLGNHDPTDFTRPPDPSLQRPWVHRAWRAHLNLLEQAMPFAVLVLVAHLAGVSTPVTVWASVLFVVLRVAHAAGMITGVARFPARPIIFTAGWLCVMAIGVELLRLA